MYFPRKQIEAPGITFWTQLSKKLRAKLLTKIIDSCALNAFRVINVDFKRLLFVRLQLYKKM